MEGAVFNYKRMIYQRKRFSDPKKRAAKNSYQNMWSSLHRDVKSANTARWRKNNPERAAEHIQYLHDNRYIFDTHAYVMRRWKEWAYYVLLANFAKPGCTGHCTSPHFDPHDRTPKLVHNQRICSICLQIMDHLNCPCCKRPTEHTVNRAALYRHRWGEVARHDHILILCEVD